MKKKVYELLIRETNNPRLLKNILEKFVEMLSEFSSVELVVKEVKKFKNKNLIELRGLDPWL